MDKVIEAFMLFLIIVACAVFISGGVLVVAHLGHATRCATSCEAPLVGETFGGLGEVCRCVTPERRCRN